MMMEHLNELLNKVSTSAIPQVSNSFLYSAFYWPDILDDQGITAFTLKAGLLVQGVTKLAFQTSSLDPTTVAHLRSAPVWAAAAQ